MSTIVPQTVAVFCVGASFRLFSNLYSSQQSTLFDIGYTGFRAAYIQLTASLTSHAPGWFGQASPHRRAFTHVVCATIPTIVEKLLFKHSTAEVAAIGLVSTGICLYPYIRDNLLGEQQLAITNDPHEKVE
jgi:hypothetical protein